MAGRCTISHISRAPLSEVVSQILFTEEHEKRHQNALRQCLDTLEQWHMLGKTHHDVEEDLRDLQERLSRHAQHNHAAALECLISNLHTHLAEQGEADDLVERLLCLLVNLCQRPGSVAAPVVNGLVSNKVNTKEEVTRGNVSWNEHRGSCASSDTLSHWSDSDDERSAASLFESERAPDRGAGHDLRQRHLKLSVENVTMATKEIWRPKMPPALEQSPSHPPLAQRLLKSRGPSGRLMSPTLEQAAVDQVIMCLRGHVSDGPVLQLAALDNLDDDVTIVPGVHVAQLSATSLSNYLAYFAKATSHSLRVRAFVDRMMPPRVVVPSEVVEEAVAAAFAIAQHVRQLNALLLAMCGNSLRAGDSTTRVTTLLQAYEQTVPIVARFALLESIVESITASMLSLSPAASVINGLVALLDPLLLQGGPQGISEGAVVLDIIISAVRPLLQHTQVWLEGGGLRSPHSNFFIREGSDSNPRSSGFWQNSYELSGSDDDCPGFLRQSADGILAAGKARILLLYLGSMAPSQSLPPTGSNRSDSQTEGLVQLCTSRLRKALATFCPLAGTSPTTALDPLASGHEKDDRVKAASSLLQQLQAASAQLTLSTSEPRSFGTVTLSSGPVASAKEKVPLPTKPQSVADGPTAAPHAQEVTTEEASCGSSELELSPSRPLPLLPCWNLEAPNLPLPPLLPGAHKSSLYNMSAQLWGASRNEAVSYANGGAWGSDVAPGSLQFCCASELMLQCVIQPIRQMVDATEAQLLRHIHASLAVLSQLRQLKALFLLGAPAACDFAGRLFEELDSVAVVQRLKAIEGSAVPIGNEADKPNRLRARLQHLLTEALSAAPTWHSLPIAASTTVSWSPLTHTAWSPPRPRQALQGGSSPSPSRRARRAAKLATVSFAAGGSADVAPISQLSIDCRVGGIAAVTVSKRLVSQFHSIFLHLLKVRWAVHSLQSVHPRRGDTASPAAALRSDMLHFTSVLHHWSLHTALECDWPALEQAVREAASLADITKAQNVFIEKAASVAFDPTLDRASALMAPCLTELLAACKLFCLQWQRHQAQLEARDVSPIPVDVISIGSAFNRQCNFFFKVLRSRTREVGGDTALRHLISALQGERAVQHVII